MVTSYIVVPFSIAARGLSPGAPQNLRDRERAIRCWSTAPRRAARAHHVLSPAGVDSSVGARQQAVSGNEAGTGISAKATER